MYYNICVWLQYIQLESYCQCPYCAFVVGPVYVYANAFETPCQLDGAVISLIT